MGPNLQAGTRLTSPVSPPAVLRHRSRYWYFLLVKNGFRVVGFRVSGFGFWAMLGLPLRASRGRVVRWLAFFPRRDYSILDCCVTDLFVFA